MDREASRRGYLLLLSNMHDDSDQAAVALRTMRGRVDGLLVMAPHIAPETLEQAIPPALPSILLNSHADLPGRPALRFDNRAGAEAMVEHLVANGYRHIVHIAGPDGNLDAAQRAEGYLAVCARHHLPPRILPGNFNEEAGEAAARAILASATRTDAVFAANDMMAIGCLHALRDAGTRVPEDIAVAGFYDVPLARYLSLSTVRVNIAEMGARAVARLIDLLEGKDMHRASEILTPELVMRATTAPRTASGNGAAHA
jgi:LacI family transcriptional regulator